MLLFIEWIVFSTLTNFSSGFLVGVIADAQENARGIWRFANQMLVLIVAMSGSAAVMVVTAMLPDSVAPMIAGLHDWGLLVSLFGPMLGGFVTGIVLYFTVRQRVRASA